MQLTPDDLSSWEWLRKLLAYATFGATGGVLGHIMRAISKKQRIKVGRACVEGLGAAFVGALVMMLCQAMGLSEQWTGVIVGVCGWLGAEATIGLLEKVVYQKLGITKGQNNATGD